MMMDTCRVVALTGLALVYPYPYDGFGEGSGGDFWSMHLRCVPRVLNNTPSVPEYNSYSFLRKNPEYML
jgi:hypothetical protein